MLVITRKNIVSLLCIILNLFIFFDIINGAGRVHPFFMTMNSLFLALYCMITFATFMLIIKWKMDKIPLFVLWIMVWQLFVAVLMWKEISLNMIYQIAGWPLLFVAVYQLTKNKEFNLPEIKYISLLWIAASAYVIYILRTQMFNDVYRTYYLIISIPFFIGLDKKWKYSRLILITLLIMLTYKRTGFMALVIAFFLYYLCDIYIQKKQTKKIHKIFFGIILLTILMLLLMQYGDGMAVVRRLKRISIDNGSDRFRIWTTLINYFKSESLFHKIIGNGYKSCYYLLDGTFAAAHNDFIEILLDYGIIGLFNHVILVALVGKKVCEFIKIKAIESSGFVYMFFVWIIFMLFSFITWQSILMKPVAMYFAYMIAKFKYHKRETVKMG